ncbi:hypothetical protein FOPE_02919 [Fonsecaea pedrosoi]|nr:hypothetical protein FOPE_02919 [Fonsecaea pedrosoi]
MSKLRGIVHGLVEKARTRLYRDLLLLNLDQRGHVQKGSTPIPALDLSALRDDPTNIADGWSFLSGNRSVLSVDGGDWLYDRIFTESYLRQQFILADLAFKKDLLVLIYMTGGGPGRGTEILTVRHRNDSTGEGRGIFIDGGLVDIVVGYHKGYGFSAKSKIIHRFLPREEPRGRDEVQTDEDDDYLEDDGPEYKSNPVIDGVEDDELEHDVDPTTDEERPPLPVSTNVDGF